MSFSVVFSLFLLLFQYSLAVSTSHSASQNSEDENGIDLTLRLGRPNPEVTKTDQNVSISQRQKSASRPFPIQNKKSLHQKVLTPQERIRKEKNSHHQRNHRIRMKIYNQELLKQRDHAKYTRYRNKILQGDESEKRKYQLRRNAMNRASYHQRKLKYGFGRKRNRTSSRSNKLSSSSSSSDEDQLETSPSK